MLIFIPALVFSGRYPPYSDNKIKVLVQLLKKRSGIPMRYFGYLGLFSLGILTSVVVNKMVKN